MLNVATEQGQPRTEQNRRISEVVQREGSRLLHFIRSRIDDQADAEDILQDVFFELVEAYRLMKPVEQAGAWVYRVARNRIIDRFRKRKGEALARIGVQTGDEDVLLAEDLLPSPDAEPDAIYARSVLLEDLDAAVDELPEEQREIFIAHEIDGRSFKELGQETGLSINTLLSRKRYAVLYLRRRLQAIHDEFVNA